MSSAGGRDRWERATARGRAVRESLPVTSNLMLWGVLLAVVVALVLRVVFLGHRVAHYDEGRVAYWATYTLDTGHFAYRRIIHGPLLQHLDRYLFAIVGASDFTMRLPVAIVGSLLPATALLFRRHLNRVEVVAMAFFLALNPVLLYYSRFMRSDILVAAFMFTALGLLVRYYDTRLRRYVYAATVFVVLGFGSKENAIVYVLTWLGAAALLADQALYRPRNYDSGAQLLWAKISDAYGRLRYEHVGPWFAHFKTALGPITGAYQHVRYERIGPWLASVDVVPDRLANRINGPRPAASETAPTTDRSRLSTIGAALSPLRFVWYAIAVAAIATVVFLYVYAPRGAGVAGLRYPTGNAAAHLGLWDAVGDPTKLPALLDTTWNRFFSEFMEWFSASTSPGCNKNNIIDGYLCYAGRYVRVMGVVAAPLSMFAVFGFATERWGARTTRNLAMFAAYGGFVSVIGYPLGTDVWGAWIVVHAMVPLSIPAAVGVGVIVRWGREAFDAKDAIGVAIAVLILLAGVGYAGYMMTDTVYTNDQSEDNRLVQYAQPGDDMQPAIAAMGEAAAATDGTDVVLYGQGNTLVSANPNRWQTDGNWEWAKDPMCSNWHDSLPMAWYYAMTDADVSCVTERGELLQRVENGAVPVVLTAPGNAVVPEDALAEAGYVPRTYDLRTYETEITFWIQEEYAGDLPPAARAG